MTSIAIVGPGAVGGTVAAHLSQVHAGAVSVAARTPFEVLEVTTDQGVIRAQPLVLTHPSVGRAADWVLVATKTYDVAATVVWLKSLVGPHSVVVVLQNGVEHVERFSAYVPSSQILPVVLNLPVHRIAPGRTFQRGPAELAVPRSVHGQAFAKLFTGTDMKVQLTDDFVTAAWTKLAFNATGAVTAATLAPSLDLRHLPTEHLVRRIAEEALAVGRAAGAQLGESAADKIVATLAGSRSHHPNSMHADRLAGRPMEIDARNGAIVRFGRRHSISTPVNSLLVELLETVNMQEPL